MEGRMLTVTETAARLGVSDDTVRRLVARGELAAVDTRAGRRFHGEQVDKLRRDRGGVIDTEPEPAPPARVPEPPAPPAPVPPKPERTREEQRIAAAKAAEVEAAANVQQARADVEITEARVQQRETVRKVRTEREREDSEREQRAQAKKLAAWFAMLKAHGMTLAAEYPPSVRAQLARELEEFVQPEQFPDWIGDGEARQFVADKVAQVAAPWEAKQRAEQERHAAELRDKREREMREVRRVGLIVWGKDHALSVVGPFRHGWSNLALADARAAVARVLENEVGGGPEWDHDRVSARVEQVLAKYGPDDDDDELDDDELDDDELDDVADDSDDDEDDDELDDSDDDEDEDEDDEEDDDEDDELDDDEDDEDDE